MKTRNKALLLTLCAVLLVTASVLGTMAFLTSNDEVVNTFSVGSVAIRLDEAKANTDGSLVEGAARVKANSYKLLPGHTYNKDPMVTVLNGSEASYIKMTVTFSKASALDAIFAPTGADLTSIFNGYDSTNWIANTHCIPCVAMIPRSYGDEVAFRGLSAGVPILYSHFHGDFDRYGTRIAIKYVLHGRGYDLQKQFPEVDRRLVGESTEHDVRHFF